MATSDIDLERERMAWIFGLTGGELHEPHPDFSDPWDGVFAWWYEGVPGYVADEHSDADQHRTALAYCLWGPPETPEGWERVDVYVSSGETACGWCGDGTGHEDTRSACPLCEGDGVLYIGEGWAEVVFRAL